MDEKDCPSTESIEREVKIEFAGLIPDGRDVSLFRWREKNRGEDFHARYVLTDKGGIRIDAGFSAEGSHQTTDMQLMNRILVEQKTRDLY